METSAAKTNGKHPMEGLLKSGILRIFRVGEIVEGTVIEKRGSKVFVDLGQRGTGIIFGREYYEAQDILKGLSVGDPIAAKVVELDNEDGYVELSLKEAGRERNWQTLKRVLEEGTTVDLKVSEANRGGLIMEYLGVKGFLPVSQLSSNNYPRVQGGDKEKIYEELKKFIGKALTVKIMDVEPMEGKLIFSERSMDDQKLREKLAHYPIGAEVDGEITGIVDFGAFMKFGEDIEGLIHISEIDWQLIEKPSDMLKIGEKVRAKIIDIQGDKVSLSLKALKENPWLKAAEKYTKGDVVMGSVTKFNPFGAFVRLDEEIQALVHISEFGSETKMRESLALGTSYEFTILMVDPKEHRIGLALGRKEIPAESATAEEPAKA
ncbi:MAG: 30S ribosomal protein S1 [Candidatus Sungbacteria bacterium RIFCSPLOWO2_02_FULL_51_17]|uniref:30S ribosomal protein S1 n=1 Tax=Candidatus Sungbacteria bacterium RIFCSPHIGHO2_02_FULL_51_29 TaxID=1802273 RepID=A0A1G2KRF9_9BACT|nr:MAG: 30S ribosomal protein S1 [Candidatus Sungbacteria bacterium RIFCSPHIGHO2_01_FULL_51_22]OHA01970.1 MAG: 30S ribosomal protein S1 [Candidatus Sungbacteria bacterium RIFCSPHIGHO2_02_FULL_51_29]OHA11156.1 MAG: 30S ribosomal protein S1 [Candidatus Sungbacteria bacterium RIFCSPLOWO2_02_FULL_51_17]